MGLKKKLAIGAAIVVSGLFAQAEEIKKNIKDSLSGKPKTEQVINPSLADTSTRLVTTIDIPATNYERKTSRDYINELAIEFRKPLAAPKNKEDNDKSEAKKKKTDSLDGSDPEKDENPKIEEEPTTPAVTETSEEPDTTLFGQVNAIAAQYTTSANTTVKNIANGILGDRTQSQLKADPIKALFQIAAQLNGMQRRMDNDAIAFLEEMFLLLDENGITSTVYDSHDYKMATNPKYKQKNFRGAYNKFDNTYETCEKITATKSLSPKEEDALAINYYTTSKVKKHSINDMRVKLAVFHKKNEYLKENSAISDDEVRDQFAIILERGRKLTESGKWKNVLIPMLFNKEDVTSNDEAVLDDIFN